MKASKQTRLKLRKGFDKAPIRYTVLMVAQFTKEDEKEIAKGLLKATTPDKAKDLLFKVGKPSKWSMVMVTLTGNYNVWALRYKGLEVAALWRRQTSEVIPDPSDPVPEGVLENPDDVWAVMYLNNKSARQLVGVVAEDLKAFQLDHMSLKVQIEAQQKVIQANDKTIATLQGRIKALEAKKKK